MAPTAPAFCIVLDIGPHMGDELEHGLECIKMLVQRKFFAEHKDEFALVLCGTDSDELVLGLNSESYTNITLARELAKLNWDLLQYLNQQIQLSHVAGDLLSAVDVAVHHLITTAKEGKQSREKRVVVVSNLLGPVDDGKLYDLIEKLREEGISLSLIGTSLRRRDSDQQNGHDDNAPPSDHRPGDDSCCTTQASAVFQELLSASNGESYSFAEAIPSLSLFESRAVLQRGWKVNLTIGDKIMLPVKGYTQVKETRPPAMHSLCAAEPSVPIKTVTTYHRQDANMSEVPVSDTVRGYRYGTTVVPFSDEDVASTKLTVEKGLDLIGFTRAENVPRSYYVGDSVSLFVPDVDMASTSTSLPPAAAGLGALAQALFELDAVALVRRVYNRVSSPVLGVLTPEIHASSVGLAYTELAFSEDVRTFTFASLPVDCGEGSKPDESKAASSARPTTAHLQAMNRFIDEMLLAGDESTDEEAEDDQPEEVSKAKKPDSSGYSPVGELQPAHVPNPWLQRVLTCLRERGLNSAANLGSSVLDESDSQSDTFWLRANYLPGLEDLIANIEAKTEARAKLRACLPPLVNVQKRAGDSDEVTGKAKRQRLDNEPFGSRNTGDSATLASNQGAGTNLAVGTADPIADFQRLLPINPKLACHELEARITQFATDVYTASLLRGKAVKCLECYREMAVQRSSTPAIASAFNTFLREWKEDLRQREQLRAGGPVSTQVSDTEIHLRKDFWKEIVQKKLNLIRDFEVPGVAVSQLDADSFLSIEIQPVVPSTAATVGETEESEMKPAELDDLLGELN